jgi:hypothetical protein
LIDFEKVRIMNYGKIKSYLEDVMVIWQDVPVIIKHRSGKRYFGEVPVQHFNEQTGKIEAVVNNRGEGYAGRNRLKYRPTRKQLRERIKD